MVPASSECSRALAITLLPALRRRTKAHLQASPVLQSTAATSTTGQGRLTLLHRMPQEVVESEIVRDAFALESLVGQLLHATMVSGLFQVLCGMQHAHGQLRHLNPTTRADTRSMVVIPSFHMARVFCASVSCVRPTR